VSTRPLRLNPALQEAVERARADLSASGQLTLKPGEYQSPLGADERAAVARIVRDGTYGRLADMVAYDDPELADQ
jgi:hypothetical protein